jgi:hypothetical protein
MKSKVTPSPIFGSATDVSVSKCQERAVYLLRHTRYGYLIAFFVSIACQANAQTYFKCTNSLGKIEFSDRACKDRRHEVVMTQHINSMDTSELRRNIEVQRSQQQEERRVAALNDSTHKGNRGNGNSNNVCPSDIDIRNLETKASSITLHEEDRTFLQAEIRRARACKKEGGQYDAEDWKKIKDAQDSVNNIQSRDRASGRASAEGIHSVSASDRENARMIADKQVEAERRAAQAAERAAAAAEAAAARRAQPSSITSCDPGGCWDSLGGRYNSTPEFPS